MKLQTFIRDFYLPEIERTRKPRTVAETARLLTRLVIPKLGVRDVGKVSYSDIQALHVSLRSTPVQANRVHAALSGVYAHAIRMGQAQGNPCAGISLYAEKPRERYLTPDEINRLRAAIGDDDAGKVLQLLLLTGARPSEWLAAEWRWLHGNVLRLPDSKRGARNVYLPPQALAILEPLVPKTGRIFKDRPDIRRAFARATRTAKIEGVRIYDLRHTFASAALASGVSLPVIGQLLGHRHAQTTLRYAHLAPEVGLEAAAKAAERIVR